MEGLDQEMIKYSPFKRIAYRLIIILIVGIFVEGGARLIYIFKDQIKSRFSISKGNFDQFEMLDPQNRHNFFLRPGFTETLEEAIKSKKKQGKVLSVKILNDYKIKYHIRNDEVIYQINQDGFKGPEIDKSHSQLRILTIGDSCTFGTLIDKYSYPRVMERRLRQLGHEVEVINGGVEGYSSKNVLFRIKEFKELRPEITTIYIGWNNLYSENLKNGIEKYFFSFRLFKKVYKIIHSAIIGPQKAALEEYKKAKNTNRNSSEVKRFEVYVPSFIKDVEQIVKEMQSVGSKVVTITLAGLYTMEEEPSELALKIGHLPNFTDNPYVLANMTKKYNIALRKLAKKEKLLVIDLEKWSKTAFRPRDAYFLDSVHLNIEGYKMVGIYLAEELFISLLK